LGLKQQIDLWNPILLFACPDNQSAYKSNKSPGFLTGFSASLLARLKNQKATLFQLIKVM
jgi:hypothetical protein